MDGGDAVDPYNTQLRETLRQTYLREKNAKERGQRYSAAAAEQITYHGKELHTRSPLRLAQPPGVGAHSLLVGSGADAGSSALDLHIGSGGGSGGDARQEYDAASSLDQKQHRPEINPADTSSSSYSSSSTAYQDKLRNPNPSSSLSEAQLRRRWKLSARVAWARNADTVDEAAEELRRSVNAYNFEKCVQLIQERMLQMQEQNEILAGKRGEVALRRAQGLPRLPSLVTVTTSTGETALTKACGERGQGAAVEVLIAVGLNVNATNHHGRTALMKASAAGQQIAVGLLLGSGADVFLKDKGGRTALDWSRLARQGHISAILESHVVKSIEKRRLVRYHAERNKDLRVVVQKNTAARERIAAATAANDMDKLWTALDALSGSVSKEQYLEAREKLGLDDPVAEAAKGAFYVNVEIHGWTPLTRAAANGNEPVVEKLIDEGATVDYEVRKLGHTALTWACTCGHIGVVSMLLMRGASLVNRTGTSRDTPLMVAVHHNRIMVVLKIVEQLSSWSLAERRRRVNLSTAARSDAEKNELLSKDWVDFYRDALFLQDIKGESAVDIAQRKGFTDISEIFVNALERVRRRHEAAEAVRQAAIKVPCSLGCGHSGTRDRIKYHEERYCPRRLLPCPLRGNKEGDCNASMRAELIEEHVERHCVMRPVRCKNCYHGCMETMQWKDAGMHARKFCKKRTVECRLGCGKVITFDRRVPHEQNECVLRVASCPIGCGRHDLKVKDIPHHTRDICPKRLVACPYRCGTVVRWEELDEHVDKVCLQECRWGCGCPRMAPVDRRRVHELHLCPLRIVPCHLACGITGLLAKDRDHHEKELCPERLVPCSYGCGEWIRAKALHFHLHGEEGAGGEHAPCPKRPLHCLYNYVHKRLQIFNAIEALAPNLRAGRPGTAELRQLFADKKKGHLPGTANREEDNFTFLGYEEGTHGVPKKVPAPADTTPFSFIARCIRVRTQDLALEFITETGQKFFAKLHELRYHLIDQGDWPCGVLLDSERRDHHAFECPSRHVFCRNGCGQLMQYKQLEAHESDRCELLLSTCTNGCGHTCTQATLDYHEQNECQLRNVQCDCHKYIHFNDLKRHVEDECSAKLMYCRRGCGTQLPRNAMQDHLVKDCGKRVVECDLGCGIKKMWLSEKASHEANACPHRLVKCRLECNVMVRYRDRKHHEDNACELRDIDCPGGCGVQLPLWQTKDHLTYDCTARLMMCPQGCGKEVRWANIDHHSEEECANRHFMCHFGCGQSVLKKFQTRHEETECILRAVDCDNGCGDTVVVRDMERHLQVCARRRVSCGANGKVCTRAMEAWVVGDTAHGRGRLQVCDVHGSTALHWAAAVGDVNAARYLLNLTGGRDIDVEAKHDGTSPLVRACIEGQEKIVELLVEEGALLECETSRGYTPLIAAVTRGWQEISIFLADSGALIEYRNHLRKTALAWANELLGPKHRVTIKLNDIADKQAAHRGLIQCITLDHFDDVYALVRDGVEHEFNALDTMRKALEKHEALITKAEAEIREYSNEIVVLQPTLDAKVAAFGDKDQATVQDLEEAVVIEAEVEDMQSISNESIKKALYNIRGLPTSQIKTVLDIRYPDETQAVVMRAVCVMKGVPPLEKPDPRGSGDMVHDWWGAARRWMRKPDFIRSLSNEMQVRVDVDDDQLMILREDYLFRDEVKEHFDYDAGGEDGDGYQFIEAMAVWVKSVEQYNTLRRRFGPMRTKAEQLRIKYEKDQIALTGEREEVERLQSQYAIMSEAVSDAQKVKDASIKVVGVTEKRLRVAEMLSYRSLGGHSALTWASMYGHTDTVEILLDHGAVLDFEDDHVHRAAALIQLRWRYLLYLKTREQRTKLNSANFMLREIAHSFLLKSKCRQLRKLRKTVRTPLTEALYNGRRETVESLLNRGALMSHATGIHPSAPLTGPFPSIRHNESATGAVFENHGPVLHVLEDGATWNPMECARRGKEDLGGFKNFVPPSAGTASVDNVDGDEDGGGFYADRSLATRAKPGGWSEINRFDETLEMVTKLEEKHNEKNRKWLEHRTGWLFARAEAKKLLALNERCGEAVSRQEFENVAEYWDQGAGCEFENKYGHTALTMAAAVEAMGVNSDGTVVTAISLLLDRETRRPNINYETTKGHTALTMACKNGRVRVIETLVDRGADINYECKDGMSALLHAAKNGQWDSVRLLIERGADPFQTDKSGKTAADWAMKRNLLGVVRAINTARAGFQGLAKGNKGKAIEEFTCPLGCGRRFLSTEGEDMEDHEKHHCPKRVVECRLGCGIESMWAQEREAHEKDDCPKRLVPCPQKCSEQINEDVVLEHMQNVCVRRMVDCPNKCRSRLEFRNVQQHMDRDCSRRKVPCSLGCGVLIDYESKREHRLNICQKREVRCKLGCGKVMLAELEKYHTLKACFNRPVKCRKGCGETLKFGDRPTHEVHYCTIRIVPCPNHCGDEMQQNLIQEHLIADCVNRAASCPLKCGQRPRFQDLDRHVRELCGNRIVQCRQECGIKGLLIKDQETHELSQCPNRTVPCGYGCGAHISMPLAADHKLNDCPKRLVACPFCPRKVAAETLQHHVRHVCKKGRMFCRFGCGEVVIRGKFAGHEKHRCVMRFVECGLGCGAEMREKDRLVHESVQCLRRMGGGRGGGGGGNGGAKGGARQQQMQKKKTRTLKKEKSLLTTANIGNTKVGELPIIDSGTPVRRIGVKKSNRGASLGQNPATAKMIDTGSRMGTPAGIRSVPSSSHGARIGMASRQSLPGISHQ